jgi:hypothetical protein
MFQPHEQLSSEELTEIQETISNICDFCVTQTTCDDCPVETLRDIANGTDRVPAIHVTTLSHDIDIDEIADSMLVDSGYEVISITGTAIDRHGTTHQVAAGIEANGDVDVVWKGKPYSRPSDFPEALRRRIRETGGNCLFDGRDETLECISNNWFELVVTIDGDVFDDPQIIEVDFTATTPEETADVLEAALLEAVARL